MVDEIVLRGMARWPNVPAVYGWLTLDRRGNWRIKGEPIHNPAVIAFIGRNYARDETGCWFFQNGPQRVFVALEYTPFVYRVVEENNDALALECHNRAAARTIRGAWLDESGALLFETEHGIGLLDDRDLDRVFPYLIDANGAPLDEETLEKLMEALQRHEDVPLWLRVRETNVLLAPIRSTEVAHRFSFVADPPPPAEGAACS